MSVLTRVTEMKPVHSVKADRSVPAWFPHMVETAARIHRVHPHDILGGCRDRRAVRARDSVVYAMRCLGLGTPHIGHLVGRDASSIHTALRRVEEKDSRHITALRLAAHYAPRRRSA